MIRHGLLFLPRAGASFAFAAEPRAIATFESIGVYWTPPSDPGPGGCAIQFRKIGESAWREGLPLWFDARNAECRGSLVHLEPGTKYEIEVGNTRGGTRITASTWSERFPIARTVRVASGTQQIDITEGGNAGGYVLYTGEGVAIDGGDAQLYNLSTAAPYIIVPGLTLKAAKEDWVALPPAA